MVGGNIAHKHQKALRDTWIGKLIATGERGLGERGQEDAWLQEINTTQQETDIIKVLPR